MTARMLFLIFIAELVYGQSYDWHVLFTRARSMDRTVQDAARDEMMNEIMPKLLSENASLLVPEIPGLIVELNDEDSFYRLQAAALFGVIATTRSDSAKVLVAAFPALEKHAQDSDRQVSDACVIGLSGLSPSIPPDVARVLADLLSPQAKISSLARTQVIKGLLSIYGSEQTATITIDSLVNGNTQKKLLFLNSFGSGGLHPNAAIIAILGQLLHDSNTSVVAATVKAIGNCGFPAIEILAPQLTDLEDQTKVPALAQQIHELLRALDPPAQAQ